MRPSTERLIFFAMCCAALWLRWMRLDLISFRYDAAEAMFRAREALQTGPPFTGIVNSLGFRNAPGFIWALLPAAVWSPRVEVVTGWMGLLTVTGMWPLWQAGRRLTGAGWWLPCLLYAVAPAQVFAGRNLWAQCLLPAMGAWVVWWLLVAFDTNRPASRRSWAMAAALAMTGAAASVHLAALLYVPLVLLGFFAMAFLKPTSARIKWPPVLLFGLLPLLTLVPSALDYWRVQRSPPMEKPAHITKFESLIPEPRPITGRLQDALGGQFSQFASTPPVQGVWEPGEAKALHIAAAADLLVFCLIFLGASVALLRVREKAGERKQMGLLLLLGAILPGIVAAILVPRVNATYLALSASVFLLLTGTAYAALPRRIKPLAAVLVGCACVGYVTFTWSTLQKIDRTRFVPGIYYIPLADQQEMAEKLAREGASAQRISHLSGEWFQRSYEYLLKEVVRAPELHRNPKWGVLEDANLRREQPIRRSFFQSKANFRHGSVSAVVHDSETEALELIDAYYALPLD